MANIAVAGASGSLGRMVVADALARGHRVVALGRDEGRLRTRLGGEVHGDALEIRRVDALVPDSLRGACEGCEAVISCMGASVSPALGAGRAGYLALDWPANRALADAAKAGGVGRFVYVSVAGHDLPGASELAYYRAHEQVVAHLDAIGQERAILRPTGFFSALSEYVHMARRGRVPMIGEGLARSNPIADADLAAVCVDALEGPPRDRSVGGPDVLSRREMIELAFAALGREPKIAPLAPRTFLATARVVSPCLPRMGELLPFVVFVSTHDVVADAVGRRRLADAFRDLATTALAPTTR